MGWVKQWRLMQKSSLPIDKARKAIGHKGMNTLENYKRVLNCDDYLYNISGSFFHISDSEGETWDNFDIVEREVK